jgi:hypothetical protein
VVAAGKRDVNDVRDHERVVDEGVVDAQESR